MTAASDLDHIVRYICFHGLQLTWDFADFVKCCLACWKILS